MNNIQQILNNPLLKQIMQSGNPQQFIMNMIQEHPQMKNNAVIQNAMKMYQSKDSKGLETLGRNIVKEAGIDPDELIKGVSKVMRK